MPGHVAGRSARREAPLDEASAIAAPDAVDPEAEAMLADSVVALLVVLQTLTPAERLAFVLHDMFDLPYAEIAPIVAVTRTAPPNSRPAPVAASAVKLPIPQRIWFTNADWSKRSWRLARR